MKPVGHWWPQAPQLFASVVRLKQPAGLWQHVWPAPAHPAAPLHEHVPPAAQFSPGLQVAAPQTHVPLMPMQLPPLPHSLFVLQPQNFWLRFPLSQSSVPEQAFPQLPQLAVSVCTFVSQPSSLPIAGVLQLSKPMSQMESHTPAVQLLEATPAPEHALPQAPQLSTFAETSVSQPSSAMGIAGLMQSPKPVTHMGAHAPATHAVLPAFVLEHA